MTSLFSYFCFVIDSIISYEKIFNYTDNLFSTFHNVYNVLRQINVAYPDLTMTGPNKLMSCIS